MEKLSRTLDKQRPGSSGIDGVFVEASIKLCAQLVSLKEKVGQLAVINEEAVSADDVRNELKLLEIDSDHIPDLQFATRLSALEVKLKVAGILADTIRGKTAFKPELLSLTNSDIGATVMKSFLSFITQLISGKEAEEEKKKPQKEVESKRNEEEGEDESAISEGDEREKCQPTGGKRKSSKMRLPEPCKNLALFCSYPATECVWREKHH